MWLWLRHTTAYVSSCTFTSAPQDTGGTSSWKYLVWEGQQPAGTTLTLRLRTAATLSELASATWIDYPQSGVLISNPEARFIQYEANLSTVDPAITPALNKVTIYYNLTSSLTLQASWNLITLPLQPAAPYTPESLLLALNAQGGNCTDIDRWVAGGWESHHLGFPFGTFPITMGEGYFVLCTQTSTFIQQGSRLSTGATISLSPGFNLVGFPYPGTGQTAQSVLAAINSSGGNCSEIHRWLNSGWDSHYFVIPGLNNFDILPSAGYFVRCSTASSFTP